MKIKPIAEKVCISPGYLGKVISGYCVPSLRLAKKLEEITHIKKEAWLDAEKYFLKKQFKGANNPPQLKKWRYDNE